MVKKGSVSETALTPANSFLSKEPVLGNFMVLVAAAMKQIQRNASGARIAELLEEQLKTSVSNAQVYVALKRMQEAKLIEFVGEAVSRNGPPLKTYRLSEAGECELALKWQHTKQLAQYLDEVLGSVSADAVTRGKSELRKNTLGKGVAKDVRVQKATETSGNSGRAR